MTWVGVVAYEGVEELDLAGVVAPLTKAAQCTQHNSGLRVLTAGPTPEVTGSNGLVIGGLRTLAALSSCAAVVLPGGRGAEEAAASPLLRQAVAEAAARGAALFSVCTGALLVAAAGVPARRMAVHGGKQDLLLKLTSAEIGRGLIRDPVLTSVGGLPGPGIKAVDIAFEVIRRFAAECVPCVAQRLEVLAPSWPVTISAAGPATNEEEEPRLG
ncbi:DJ-1/PfpI family protein [Streptomyces sp. NPDC005761]|uniref:DJ-1/PfpI family protein n=1 Tax=unclassified Streptomyces TaxID=2593676 RepID=UPI0033E855E2